MRDSAHGAAGAAERAGREVKHERRDRCDAVLSVERERRDGAARSSSTGGVFSRCSSGSGSSTSASSSSSIISAKNASCTAHNTARPRTLTTCWSADHRNQAIRGRHKARDVRAAAEANAAAAVADAAVDVNTV